MKENVSKNMMIGATLVNTSVRFSVPTYQLAKQGGARIRGGSWSGGRKYGFNRARS